MKTSNINYTLGNYLFVLPALAIFSLFYIIPFIWVLQLSMFSWDGILPTKIFVGLENFKEIILQDPSWWQSMRNVGYITLIALTLQNAVAFLLAWACDREIKMKNFYRVIFFIPPVLSEIVVGMAWRFIINDIDGANIVNRMLVSIGLPQLAHNWLSDPKTALPCIAIVHSWKGFGWGFVILLAGLQSIPRELYEAARVDGANSWIVFRHVTAPLMIPVFILVSILTILGTMQIFDIIISTTGGGPGYHTEVPITRIVATMIGSSQFGYACTMGVVFGLVLLVISMIQIQASKMMRQV